MIWLPLILVKNIGVSLFWATALTAMFCLFFVLIIAFDTGQNPITMLAFLAGAARVQIALAALWSILFGLLLYDRTHRGDQ